jgi:zinc protease
MLRFLSRASFTLAVLGGWLLTGRPVAADDLPKAEEILDKYVKVTGGKEAYEKAKNRVSQGTMTIAPLGIKGKVTVYEAAPNKRYLEAELAGVGKIEEGTDGQTAWEKSTLGGARIKQGGEKATALNESRFNADADWRKVYKKAECMGEEKVDGKPAYKVELTTPDGQVRTIYYDKASGLVVKAVATLKTQMGEVKTETSVSDYRKVDGLLMPFKLRQKVLTQEMVIAFDKVEQNVKLPANRFDLPEDIKKLVDKEKK